MALTKVSTDGVKDDAITKAKIPANQIEASEIANDSVGTNALTNNAVHTANIADDAVTTAKIADDAVDNEHIANNAVRTLQIIDNAVNDSKIADSAITSAKLGASAVTTGKINDQAVTAAKIADTTITSGQLAASSVTTSKINNGAVTDAKITGMAASKLTGALPAISGANLTGISGGLAVFDQWRLSTGQTITTQDVVLTSWERPDTSGTGGGAYGGSGMSQSSGVFSFPATGIYLITYHGVFNGSANTRYSEIDIVVTKNNSSYVEAARTFFYYNRPTGTSTGSSATCTFLMDVDNISNDKVRFECSRADVGNFQVLGDSTINMTTVTFLRLGDT